ncbi:unnamed protein product [Malus baccata var. baccata]
MEEQNFTDYFPQTPLANSEPANATETFMESSTMNLGSNEVNGMKLLLESADEIGVRLEFDGDKTGVRFESDGDEHEMKKWNYAGGFPVYPALGELMPHILTVKLGENILSQLLLLSQSTNRAMCILSAVGVVSIVCIRKLSGSYLRFKA